MHTPDTGNVPAASSPGGLSLFARVVAIFVRPASAWGGLETRVQWWFPVLLVLVLQVGVTVLLYDRALMPMLLDQWEQQVENGQMTSEQVAGAEQFMSQPAGRIFVVVQQAVVVFGMTLLSALACWFGVGFVLGSRMKYRHALEVVGWASLVMIPAMFLTTAIGWSRETLLGVHVGFAALLPEGATGKLMTGLKVFLDNIGPFSIWYLVVAILGASALSGAPRRPVAMVLGGLYLVILLFAAALSAMFAPAS